MSTTSIAATSQFAAGSSRGPSRGARRADTLRTQVAAQLQARYDAELEAAVAEIEEEDLARGQRIRELRDARRLTQPAVWERMCEIAGPKPDGRPFISFRMYQRYEQGSGISWKSTRVLAQALDATEDYILRGEGERRQPRPARSVDVDIAERLARVEEEVRRGREEMQEVRRTVEDLYGQREGFLQLLADQQRVLEGIAAHLGDDALSNRADKAVEASIERARVGLAASQARASQAAAPGPAAAAGTRRPRHKSKA